MQKKPMFEEIYAWSVLFRQLDRDIAVYNQYEWNEETTKERLIEKREALLATAKSLTAKDLLIFYYMKKKLGISALQVYKMLRKQYCTVRELKKVLNGKEETWDIERVGAERKKKKKIQKNP